MDKVISTYKDEIVHSVEEHNVVIVSGFPDNYMYSYVPFYLYSRGFTKSNSLNRKPPKICTIFNDKTQVAYFSDLCSSLTNDKSKVTSVLDVNSEYNVKSEIVYTTNDYILKLLLTDPLISEFSVFVVCDVHERSLNTDLLLAFLKSLLAVRSRLRLVLLTHSKNVNYLISYFKDEINGDNKGKASDDSHQANGIHQSRLRDVYYIHMDDDSRYYRVNYLPEPTSNYLDSIITTVYEMLDEPGNILIFVPTRDHAQVLKSGLDSMINQSSKFTGIVNVMCLRAENYLDDTNTDRYLPEERRNVFICTSVTDYQFGMGEITYMIDSCLTKRKTSDYINTGVSESVTSSTREEMVIRASLIKFSGECFRLITENDYYTTIQASIEPEIMTKDLTMTVLLLKSLGFKKLSHFDFLTKPPTESLKHSLYVLYLLGAIDGNGDLVYPIGNLMAELRVTPYLSNFLYNSVEKGCSEEALIIFSILQVKDILWKRAGRVNRNESSYIKERLESAKLTFAANEGDLISYFNVFQLSKYYKDEDSRWFSSHMINEVAIKMAQKIKIKTAEILSKYHLETKSCDGDVELLVKTIFSSFFLNVACKEHLIENYQNSKQFISSYKQSNKMLENVQGEQQYVLVKWYDKANYKKLYIHPSSFIAKENPDWLVFNESTQIDGKIYMEDVTKVKPE
ncbi:hypothetical protein MACJ_000095 [Theileria orientalis]|uniref:Helicase-associated domain-containing protein n=1 Tax=Theileria orientalis TaxID=68886 RepID=A0A976QPL5_THEOR|nr:hypothetical protein MACJ_000095 [Theileria orientalis]